MRILRPGQKIMTIGNPGLRVISPRGGVAIPWYLAGGVSAANCIAAYQPIGAASYAASKVNLANPGTYDASEGNAPDWNTSTGWTFDATNSEYLDTGIAPTNQDWTYFLRFANRLSLGWLFGVVISSTDFNMFFRARLATSWRNTNGNNAIDTTIADSPATLCIAGSSFYINGSLGHSSFTYNQAPTSDTIWMGGANDGGAGVYTSYDLIAASIYNAVLNSDEVAAITTAMNAL